MEAELNFYPVDDLAEYLAAGHPILTPNHRLARRIKLSWARRRSADGARVWATPTVMSLDHWWRHSYREQALYGEHLPALITASQERALWLQAVESTADTVPLLRPRVAAELAREAYNNLLLWELDWRQPGLAQQFQFNADSALFLSWAGAFEQSVERLQLATIASLVPRLASAASHPCLVLAEFDELPPLYRRALEQQAGELIDYRPARALAPWELVACDSHRGELQAAVRWAKERWRHDHGQRLALLVPRLQQERGQLERILHDEFGSDPRRPESLPVNFSAGVSLARCGPVQGALQLLRLPVHSLSLAEVCNLLYSRFRDQAELDREEVVWSRLADDAREPLSPSALRGAFARYSREDGSSLSLANHLLRYGDSRALRITHPPSGWGELFLGQLADLGWPGNGPLDSLEYQQVEQFYRVLSELGELDLVHPELNYAAAVNELEQLCSSSVFQAQTPDAPIQVLGLLEAAGLSFDAVWICGMGAGDWPPPANPNPFIPGMIQRTARMPHADAARELDYAENLLRHLRETTPAIIASYSRLQDDVEMQPSPLIASAVETRSIADDRPWPQSWETVHESQALEWLGVETAPPVDADEAIRLKGGSAILANQAQCPFRAFAYHRLRARPLPDPQVALTAAERGSILHEAMFHLWGELENSARLHSLDATSQAELVQRSATQAVDSFRQGRGRFHGQALLDLEQRRLADILGRWLAVEMERGEFVVSAREQQFDFQLGPLNITLRIDRIDTLPDGRRLLVDYKSGDSKVRLWLGERPEDPQLPLYSQVLDPAEFEGLSFAVLRHSVTEYRGLARNSRGPGISDDIAAATKRTDAALNDWDELQEHWRLVLESLAREFLEGHTPVQPLARNRTCNFCGLEALCRVR